MTLTLVTPGPYALFICYALYTGLLFSLVGSVIIYTMPADFVDYAKFKYDQNHGGLYGSIFSFLQKSLTGVAAALGVAIVGILDFDATADTQSATSIMGFQLSFALIPAIGLFVAAAIICKYPPTKKQISAIQAELTERDAQADATAP